MGSMNLAVVLVGATIAMTNGAILEGVRCFTCEDYLTDLDDVLFKKKFPENEPCRESIRFDMPRRRCGKGQKCVKIDWESTSVVGSRTISLQHTERNCAIPLKDMDNMCVTRTKEDEVVLPGEIAETEVKSFKVTTCYCSKDDCNGQTTLVASLFICLLSFALAMVIV